MLACLPGGDRVSVHNKIGDGFAALLYDTLGHTDGEFTALGYQNNDDQFHTAVLTPVDATAAIPKLPTGANIFYGVNAIKGPARTHSGRGTEADITRLSTLW